MTGYSTKNRGILLPASHLQWVEKKSLIWKRSWKNALWITAHGL